MMETSGIFTVLETSLEGFSLCSRRLLGFSQCWRLLWRDFHGAVDFFWRFSRCWRLYWRDFTVLETSGIFPVLETSGDFHGASETGDFFAGIFRVLEISSGIFMVLETSLEGFSLCWSLLLGIFTVLETSGIFTVLETSLEGLSR